MAKNLLGRSRTKDKPYAIWQGFGAFGDTEVRLLKTYQIPSNESKNPYARWFVAVRSDHTYGSFDMGDSYISEVTQGMTLKQADPLFTEQYGVTVPDGVELTEWV
jgi:hypothetical protein